MYTIILTDEEFTALEWLKAYGYLSVVVKEGQHFITVFKSNNDGNVPQLLQEIRDNSGKVLDVDPKYSKYVINLSVDELVEQTKGLEVALVCVPEFLGSFASLVYLKHSKHFQTS